MLHQARKILRINPLLIRMLLRMHNAAREIQRIVTRRHRLDIIPQILKRNRMRILIAGRRALFKRPILARAARLEARDVEAGLVVRGGRFVRGDGPVFDACAVAHAGLDHLEQRVWEGAGFLLDGAVG